MNPSLVIAYQLLAVNDVSTLHALNELAWLALLKTTAGALDFHQLTFNSRWYWFLHDNLLLTNRRSKKIKLWKHDNLQYIEIQLDSDISKN